MARVILASFGGLFGDIDVSFKVHLTITSESLRTNNNTSFCNTYLKLCGMALDIVEQWHIRRRVLRFT